MIKRFRVWDPHREDIEHSQQVIAEDPEDAAEQYAEDDTDGQIEDLYEGSIVLCVEDCSLQRIYNVRVCLDYEPIWTTQIEDES